MGRTSVWIVLILCAGGVSAFAQNHDAGQSQQTQDVQQLREKVQQLEQLTQELKARLAELEKSQTGAPRVIEAAGTTAAQPTPAAPAQPNAATEPVETVLVTHPQDAPPQPPPPEEKVPKPEMEIYGFAMLDMGYDFGQINPNWFDVERPTQLPAFKNEFGQNGNLFAGVRQTRFGVKNLFPTPLGQLKTVFEFELFGVGIDAGQTTFRLRHAYGELGQLLAGQTWSPFMDPDVFPNSIEYWGPNGMVFFRNVQLRWQPIHNGNKQVMVALERPGASADLGTVQDRDILQGVQFRFPAPDISGRFRWGGKRTYIQVSGIFRYIAWDDNAPTVTTNLTGHTYGWGTQVSGNLGVGEKDTLKWSAVYGHGVENYMNDAPVDIGPKARLFDLRTPLTGEPLPVFGAVLFYDRYWNEKFSSTIGSSVVNITNTALLPPATFRRGWYGVTNLLYYPVKNVMVGGEFIWGQRQNFTDGFVYNDYRMQFSFKYNFSHTLFGGNNNK
jgi:DcaP outer membrane protein